MVEGAPAGSASEATPAEILPNSGGKLGRIAGVCPAKIRYTFRNGDQDRDVQAAGELPGGDERLAEYLVRGVQRVGLELKFKDGGYCR